MLMIPFRLTCDIITDKISITISRTHIQIQIHILDFLPKPRGFLGLTSGAGAALDPSVFSIISEVNII